MEASVIHALRQATAQRHHAIEATLRMEGAWDMTHYRQVLSGFHHYLSAWEPAMAAALPERLRGWFIARSRMPFLRADMHALRDAAPDRQTSCPSSTLAVRLPFLGTISAAMGSLYVMEGSALGGQVIARQLKLHHGRDVEQGGAYFNGWGEQTGAMWRGFRTMLEQEVGHEGASISLACQAAVDTFASLTETFESLLHERIAS